MCEIFNKCYKIKGYRYVKIFDVLITNETLQNYYRRIMKNEFCMCTLMDLSNILLDLSFEYKNPEDIPECFNYDMLYYLFKIIFIFDLTKNINYTMKILGIDIMVKIIIVKYSNIFKV